MENLSKQEQNKFMEKQNKERGGAGLFSFFFQIKK